MPTKQPAPTVNHAAGSKDDPAAYEEEAVPFDQVLRKLVNTKPAHKTAPPVPAKKAPRKPAKP